MFSQNNTIPAYLNPPTNLIFEPKKYFITVLGLLALVAFSFFQFIYLHTPNNILDGLRDITSGLETPYIAPNPYIQKVNMSGFVAKMTASKSAADLEKTENILVSLVDKNYQTDPRKANLDDAKNEVKSALDTYLANHSEFKKVTRSLLSPSFSASIALKDLSKLSSDADIAFFDKNSELKKDDIVIPHKVLGAQNVWTATQMVNGQTVPAGATGSGQTVVLIDDGFDRNAPTGIPVLWGACFSKTDTDIVSSCTSGNTTDLSSATNQNPSYGDPCPTILANKVLCTHGTVMGGLIAARTATADQTITNATDGSFIATDRTSGMAPGASILSIKIGHEVTSNTACGYNVITGANAAPCYRMEIQELLDALNYVRNIKGAYETATSSSIAAISGSLSLNLGDIDSSNYWPAFCDSNLPNGGNSVTSSTFKTVIDQLNQLNVPSFFATGNNNQYSAISFPACLSNAISVGALNQTFDNVASFSNMNRGVDLLAPGENIVAVRRISRTPTAPVTYEFTSGDGTSQATAIASGAYALLKSGMPANTQYTQIQHAMKYGVSYLGNGGNFYIKDTRLGVPANYNDTTPALTNGNVFSSMYVNMKLLPVGSRGMEYNPAVITNKGGKTVVNAKPHNYAIYNPSSNDASKFTASRVSFSLPTATHATQDEIVKIFFLIDTDMNGDHLPDLYLDKRFTNAGTPESYIDGQPSIFYFNKDGSKTAETSFTGSANPLNGPGREASNFFPAGQADVNSDGNQDLIYFGTDQTNKRMFQIWYLDSNRNVISITTDVLKSELDTLFSSSNLVGTVYYIGDVNGDGITDFIIHTESLISGGGFTNDNLTVYLMKKNGTNTSTTLPLSVDKTYTTPFDASGSYLCGGGRTTLLGQSSLTPGCPTGFYDLNGDGILDNATIAASIVGGQKLFYLEYQVMNSTYTSTPVKTLSFNVNGTYALNVNEFIEAFSDMNFDGVPDLITYEQNGLVRTRRVRYLKFDTLTGKMVITGEVRTNANIPDVSAFFSNYVPYYHK